MKRILSLDGGGIRGIFSITILERMESILRETHAKENPGFVLADYFDFIGGTSTGAIIAAMLSKGMTVSEIRESYEQLGPIVFCRKRFWKTWNSFYGSAEFAKILRELFEESPGQPMTMASEKLRTHLLLAMRNGSTGSTWTLTNHPEARYNRRKEPEAETNIDLPLWKLIRASTAAPVFFPSELIDLRTRDGELKTYEFVDGGISPYNNPSVAMFLSATLPQYAMNYPTGRDRLSLHSIGTGSLRPSFRPGELGQIHFLDGALRSLRGLIESNTLEQDKLCRVLGDCRHGHPIDREFGAMIGEGQGLFRYYRYQHIFTPEEVEKCRRETGSRHPLDIDDMAGVPVLREIGEREAGEQVAEGHFG